MGREDQRQSIPVLAAVVSFGMLEIGSIYGFLIFPDEFAYWSCAAWTAGYDWSDITSLGPYFSYGYGLILFPIFRLCRDAVLAYRIAVSINYALLVAAYFFLVCTVRKMIPDRAVPVSLFAALTISVPWNLFYAQMTMTETLLLFLYTVTGYLLYRYLTEEKLSVLILLLLTMLYAYSVHMRTAGILVSAAGVLAMHILRGEKKWHFSVILGITVLSMSIAVYMKDYTFSHVYGSIDPALAADNDYSGQFAKLGYVCTGKGFYDLIVTLLGGILYLGLATFGLFYWGFYALIRYVSPLFCRSDAKLRKTEQTLGETGGSAAANADGTARAEMAGFLILTVVTQLIIASIHLLQIGEVDDYTYGRYGELVVPFVMTVGFAAMWKAERRRAMAVTGIIAILHAAVLFLVVRQITHTGTEKYLGYFMVGISYLYRPEGYTLSRFYAGAWFFGELLTLSVMLLLFLCRSHTGRHYLMTLLAVAELALAVHADNLYLMPFKNAAFRDTRVADRIVSLCDGEDRDVIYMDSCRPAYIGILQFMGRDMDIQVMKGRTEPGDCDGEISADDILIFAFDDEYAVKWADRYAHEDTYGHFTILYND